MARKYTRPPVVEAVCEFRFASNQPWDITLPGRLYDRIRDEFSLVEPTNVVEVTVSLGGENVGQQQTQTQSGARILTENRTEFVQVSPHQLSIHQLPPYQGWDHFKTRIFSMLAKYQELIQATAIVRIGLRYIDRVELPPGQHELDDYFNFMPRVPNPIPQIFQSFLAQVQVPYISAEGEMDSFLRLGVGNAVPTNAGNYVALLDLDIFTPDSHLPGPDEVPGWLDRAHARLEEAFDASFTEKTHTDIFGEVKS